MYWDSWQGIFLLYAQKLSGRAKTFRVAMLPCYLGFWASGAPSLGCQFWGTPHLHDVSFEGPLTCWMSVLRVPSLAGCQFLEGPLTCLDVMWSLFWSKLDLKMKIWPTSGRFGENCLLKLVLVCPILTQWWNKKNWVYFPFKCTSCLTAVKALVWNNGILLCKINFNRNIGF